MNRDDLFLVSLICAAIPAFLLLVNAWLYRPPKPLPPGTVLPAVSILIPARNEERCIASAVEAAAASVGIECEIIVLDDQSTDRTAAIVHAIAAKDARVRLESAAPLPAGWSGKQFACLTLSKYARNPILVFLDADVRLAPDGVARMVRFLQQRQADLVSGIPYQETGTLLEKLIIPLIHFLLLGFLPLVGMRLSRWSAFAAGCGQLLVTTKSAYEACGGHALVRASLHDGVKLPRAYRKHGLWTELCDATDLATCRMYRSASEVWYGFAKNAREGLAATGAIVPFTILLGCGQVLPWLAALGRLVGAIEWSPYLSWALGLSVAARLLPTVLYRQSILGALLHPLGIALLLVLQWYAFVRWLIGRPVGWKGRAHPTRADKTGG